MPLSSDSRFGVQAMTDAINALPVNPTQIRSLGLFTPKPLTTTHVDVEHLEGTLKLVQSKERGLPGDSEWTADKKATDAEGNTYYRVSSNEWVISGDGVTVK